MTQKHLAPIALLIGLSLTAGCAVDTDAVEPPAYLVVQIDSIDDADMFFGQYAPAAGQTLVDHGFIGMVASPMPNRLEGVAPDGWTVMIQFANLEAAQAWYDDPDYVAARPFRIDAVGRTDMILMPGVAGATDLETFGAYLIEQVEQVRDEAAFASYLEGAKETMREHRGTVLAEGAATAVLEGEWPDASTLVVGFPTMDDLSAWYASDAYAQLRDIRNAATSGPSVAGFAKFCDPSAETCG